MGVLDGLRVVEFTDGMLALPGAFLADYGADVTKVEIGAGDPARAKRGFAFWNRGKSSVHLPDATLSVSAPVRELLAAADVVIESRGADQMGAWGLDWATLHTLNPRLIYCSITGFGKADRHEKFGLSESIVTAKSGRLMGNDALSGAHGDTNKPIFLTAPASTFGAAMLALQGILAALLQRESTGVGRRLDTSLLDGISAATMRLPYERRGDEVIPVAARGPGGATLVMRGIRLCFLTVETSDGRFIQMCSRAPHLYRNWMTAIGLAEELETERWTGLPLGIKSEADAIEWERRVRERMKTKTQEEWMALFRASDIGADPFLTEDEFIEHPQIVQNGRVAEAEDAGHGHIKMIGSLVLAEKTPATIDRGAPVLGAAQHPTGAPAAFSTTEVAACGATDASRLPLEGVTILELASFLAAPLGATLMAELGARVIKLEPLEGDAFRTSGLEFVHIANGKESIAVDLKRPEGQSILRKLVERSDALIHNFRPGVPERIGLGYETVRRINPRLVYLYGASYGSKGPESYRPAFHPTPNALSGGGILQGGRGNRPVNDSYGDPCSGLAAGVALAFGLLASTRTGEGQYLETTMLSSVGWVHSARMVWYADSPERDQLDQEQRGYHALNGLYPCAQGWIILDVESDEQWQQLCGLLGRPAWCDDEEFRNGANRRINDQALWQRLETSFSESTAADWEQRGLAVGVPIASAADGTLEQFLVGEGLVSDGEHPEFGTYWRLQNRVRFDGNDDRLSQPCSVGEHTRAVLAWLGYSDDEIANLVDQGIVGVAP